jgi:uncharacterized protein YdcH (DUF465 family)
MTDGAMAVKQRTKTIFTKRIPLKNVRSLDGTNPRQEIVEDRVLFFLDLFRNEAGRTVAPIEVLLIQAGDPRSSIYLILEGLHRYEALKRLKASDVLANVHTEPAYTVSDLEDRKVRGEILELSCPYNANSPMPLTTKERMAAAKELNDLGYADERIAEALCAGARSIRRWLEEMKKEKKQKLKDEIVDRLKKGEPVNKLAREFQGSITEMTIMNWKKEAGVPAAGGVKKWPGGQNFTPPEKDIVLTANKPLFPVRDLLPDLTLDKNSPDNETKKDQLTEERQEEIISKLTKICDALRSLEWFDDADDLAIVHFLPILERKSERLKKVISTGGYALLYEEIKGLYDEEHGLHKKSNEESVRKDETIKKLEQELIRRQEECKRDCEYSRDWLKEELDRSMEYLLDNLEVLRDALMEGHVLDIKKKPIDLPKEANPAINQLALNAAYVGISHFEWAKLHGISTLNMTKHFPRFLKVIESLDFSSRKDIVQRIDEVRVFYQS